MASFLAVEFIIYVCLPLYRSYKDADKELPELRVQSVAVWALHRLGCIMEDGGIFFTDAQASAFVENPCQNERSVVCGVNVGLTSFYSIVCLATHSKHLLDIAFQDRTPVRGHVHIAG